MPLRSFLVNGRRYETDAPDHASLLDVLQDALVLTGTKRGCDRGECGACTVQVDGVPRYACLTLAASVEGTAVTTVEGIAADPTAAPLLAALRAHDAVQCGYCTPGQVVTAHALLRDAASATTRPDRAAVAQAMSGVLCRCGTTSHLLDAITALAGGGTRADGETTAGATGP